MALLAGGMVVLAACTSTGDDDSSAGEAAPAARDEAAAEEEAGDAAAADEATGGGGEGTSLGVAEAVAAQAREVIRTGDIELLVDDLEAATDEVRRLAGVAGGFVADEQVRAGSSEVDLTVRVPAGKRSSNRSSASSAS